MFCGKCGTQNPDNTEFCANCGARLKKTASTGTAAVAGQSQDEKNRKIGMIAVAIGVVMVIILGFSLFGGRSYKAIIQKYVNATFDADAEEMFELIPEDMVDYMLEESGYGRRDLDDLIDEASEDLQDYLDSLDRYLGEGWEIDYEILYVEDIKGDDLEDIKVSYEDADVKISAAKEVEVEITVSADETESSNSMDVSLVKVGRSWYLDIMSMGSLF